MCADLAQGRILHPALVTATGWLAQTRMMGKCDPLGGIALSHVTAQGGRRQPILI